MLMLYIWEMSSKFSKNSFSQWKIVDQMPMEIKSMQALLLIIFK